jgi:carbamate kinase
VKRSILIAIGGNALFDTENGNNLDHKKVTAIVKQLVEIIEMGFLPVLTFGNGPQVGNHLEMVENSIQEPKWPISLDMCVAWTQAEIGYTLTMALSNALRLRKLSYPILAVNTTVLVDAHDPAFLNPSKFVGHFLSEAKAHQLAQEKGWLVKQDSNRGYRRVVPSPKPQRILEEETLKVLQQSGCILICGGGGGIPIAEEEGQLRGVEAVIDKDFTACLLAQRLQIEEVIICTAIDSLYLDFATPEQRRLSSVTAQQARIYLEAGQFPPGSMGPKVEALVEFIEQGGQRAIMAQLEDLIQALKGQAGTSITSS